MRRMIIFLIALSSLLFIFGCSKQEKNESLIEVNVDEIDEIKCAGSTGGKDGSFEYLLEEDEIDDFVKLLNEVDLGEEVDEKEALSSGAVVYYTLQFTDDKTLKISPGEYFMVGETYYRFENFNELWDEFVEFKENTRDRGNKV